MGARRGRPTTRRERLRGARAFRRRNPSRRCGGTTRLGRDERFVVPSRAFTGSLHTGTGTGTGTGTRIACANGTASLSVVVQPREHHEQHGAVVVSQRARAGAEAIPARTRRSAPGAVSAAAFSKAVPPRRSARVRVVRPGTQPHSMPFRPPRRPRRRAPRACAGAGGHVPRRPPARRRELPQLEPDAARCRASWARAARCATAASSASGSWRTSRPPAARLRGGGGERALHRLAVRLRRAPAAWGSNPTGAGAAARGGGRPGAGPSLLATRASSGSSRGPPHTPRARTRAR